MNAQLIILDIETKAKGAQSIDDLCRDMGINRSTWQRIKAGRFNPSHGTLLKLLQKQQELAQ